MSRRIMDEKRYQTIKEYLQAGVGINQICKIVGATKRTIQQVRDGVIQRPSEMLCQREVPVWSHSVDWEKVLSELRSGHYLKYIWEERWSEQISYSQFTREFHKKFPNEGKEVVTRREYRAGEYLEVDYAGYKPKWVDPETLEFHEANLFIGALCYSQKYFAYATESAKSSDFIESHIKMFEYFGGTTRIIVPDNLKTGVTTPDLYDPEINKSYASFLSYYSCVCVPARVRSPKDKSIAEKGVDLIYRFFRFKYRNHTFISLEGVNEALLKVTFIVNERRHTRFKVSRNERFLKEEKESLKSLPAFAYEDGYWKRCTIYPDCHISVYGNHYSVPHMYRGKKCDVKVLQDSVEIFFNLKRIAFHDRASGNKGFMVTDNNHLPERSKAYKEATPQKILSQSRFISFSLYKFLDDLFSEGTLENLRRSQGFLSCSHKELKKTSREKALENIEKSLEDCTRWDKRRVPYFRERLNYYRTLSLSKDPKTIKRKPGNPNLRHINNSP